MSAHKVHRTVSILLGFEMVVAISTAVGVQMVFIPLVENLGIQSTDPVVIAAFKGNVDLAYALNGSLLLIAVLLITALLTIFVSMFPLLSTPHSYGQFTALINDSTDNRNEHDKDHARYWNRLLVKVMIAPLVYAYASVLIYLWLLWAQNALVRQGLSG